MRSHETSLLHLRVDEWDPSIPRFRVVEAGKNAKNPPWLHGSLKWQPCSKRVFFLFPFPGSFDGLGTHHARIRRPTPRRTRGVVQVYPGEELCLGQCSAISGSCQSQAGFPEVLSPNPVNGKSLEWSTSTFGVSSSIHKYVCSSTRSVLLWERCLMAHHGAFNGTKSSCLQGLRTPGSTHIPPLPLVGFALSEAEAVL